MTSQVGVCRKAFRRHCPYTAAAAALDLPTAWAKLCAPGYRTSSYRPPSSQTTRAKYQVVEPAYGQRNVTGELDHLVPLELGGSNDMTNFWVQAGKIPNPKDKAENQLHAMLCAGKISLHNAQLDIAHNWTTTP